MTNKAWSSYWQGGELHSCAGAFGGNYEGRMLGLWLSWFGSLPANARFLDIGTGNGAILALAKQYGEEYAKPFELHGIDFADIDPARCVAGGEELFRGVQFHPNTSAADTAFEMASVDAVTGQFSLEYMDIAQTAGELKRICRSGARLQFVVHHTNSIFVATGRKELEASNAIAQSGFLEQAGALFTRLLEADSTVTDEIEAKRQTLNATAERLGALANELDLPTDIDLVLHEVGAIWNQREQLRVDGVQNALRILAATCAEHRERLLALVAAARGREQMQDISELFRHAGFDEIRFVELMHESGHLMGWVLQLTRTDADLV